MDKEPTYEIGEYPEKAGSDWRDWFIVMEAPGFGLTMFYRLLAWFGTPGLALQASRDELLHVPGMTNRHCEAFLSYREKGTYREGIEQIERSGVKILTLHDPDYPELLRHIFQPPPILYCRGMVQPEDSQSIAVVGTRRSTSYGLSVAERLTTDLVRAGFTIISGLARGVDQMAHRAALKSGGRTVAVIGTGLNKLYPAGSEKLATAISERGSILSEFSLDTAPHRGNFPRRNRIISGLSRGVLVIEAPRKSGALITARFALEQGREVFAVPGRITSFSSVGCHRLVQDGAKLVTNCEDILVEFGMDRPGRDTPDRPDETPARMPSDPVAMQIIRILSDDPLHIDALHRQSGMSVRELGVILLNLELTGFIRQLPGKYFILDPRIQPQ